jgi:hypothetical protein
MTDLTCLIDSARSLPGVKIASITIESDNPNWGELEALVNRNPLPPEETSAAASHLERAASYAQQQQRRELQYALEGYAAAFVRNCLTAYDAALQGRSSLIY